MPYNIPYSSVEWLSVIMLVFTLDCGSDGAMWCFVHVLKAVSLSHTFPFALSWFLAISAAVVMLLECVI